MTLVESLPQGVRKIDYLVFAPLRVECDALVRQLEAAGATLRHDLELDALRVQLNRIDMVVKPLDTAGRVSAAVATQVLLNRLHPRVVLVVGIAGGMENRTSLGDIIVADQIVDGALRRSGMGSDRVSAQVYRSSRRLLKVARTLDRQWINQILTRPPRPTEPQVHVGSIASIDTVVRSPEHLAPLKESFRGLLGVEMESAGVTAAIEAGSPIEFLVIRCVVDHMNDTKVDDWHAHGAQTAAAFAVALMLAAQEPETSTGSQQQPPSPLVVEPLIAKVPPPAPLDDSGPAAALGRAGSQTRLMRDAGIGKDCLNAREYARALADVLAEASGEICFALFGHWGRGKTHLARLVERALPADYGTIWFSAWKYRSRPELWAHLHESFHRTMMQDPWWHRVPRVIRVNLDKHGIWPLVYMFLGAGVAAVPMGSLIKLAVLVLGVVGMIRGATLFFKLRTSVSATLNRFLYANRHTEKLGLQAAIGDDLRSLVIGWAGRLGWSGPQQFLAVFGYALGVASFTGGLWWGFHGAPTLTLPFLKQLQWYPPANALYATIGVVWVLAIGVLLWVRGAGRDTRRLLLIIDDLDRMPPGEMLEVIESLKLFLENEVVRDIVQIVMICEEQSLLTALEDKYGGAKPAARAVEENLQKLFIAHLRLPPLGPDEQHEVLTVFIGAEAASQLVDEAAKPASSSTEPAVPESVALSFAGPTPEPALFLPSAVEYTDDDRRALHSGLRILADGSSLWATLGPRAIQSYALRYKLARRLLEAHNEPVTPDRLATSLARCMHDGTNSGEASGSVIDAVINEVA
jgi:nucleoside phosphorylase